jgi:ABC-type uncharacterized transport system permease subunit
MELKGWDLRFPQLLCEVGCFLIDVSRQLIGPISMDLSSVHNSLRYRTAVHTFPCFLLRIRLNISTHVENFQVVSFLHVPPESYTRLPSRLYVSHVLLFHPPWLFTLIIFSNTRSVIFRNFYFLRCGIVSPLLNPLAGGPPPVGCP